MTKVTTSSKSPVRPYRIIVQDSEDPGYVNKLLIGTPTTGLVRIEWVQARYGQVIPVNWSSVQMMQPIDSFVPLRFGVADAQNLIVKVALEQDMEWLLLIEHDTCLPPDGFIRFDEYIREAKVPVVSGLYYSRGRPSSPQVYRGRGTGAYTNFKPGDLVWCDGVATGCLLIHCGILREMWKDAPEYTAGRSGIVARRVFQEPRLMWFNPDNPGIYNSLSGTSDLEWSSHVIKDKYLARAGWTEIAKKKWPYLVDTRIFCRHLDPDGTSYP